MALYDVIPGTSAVPSDVEQLINIFLGKHDVGASTLAPSLSAPSSSSFTLTSQAGNSLGIGAYNYQFTYVTGQYKSDGITLVKTGETLPSSSLSITTTSGNTTVKITLPTSLAKSVIAINIYRTSVGGSDYKLVATVKAGSTTYTDNVTDSSRGAVPPATNTTGTYLNNVISGSNSNGQYIQFPDGTMICAYQHTFNNNGSAYYAADSTLYNYPAFFDTTNVPVSTFLTAYNSCSGYSQNTVAQTYCVDISGQRWRWGVQFAQPVTTASVYISLLAIGRWKP